MKFAPLFFALFFALSGAASALTLREKIERETMRADAALEAPANPQKAAEGARKAASSTVANGAAAAGGEKKPAPKYVVNMDDFINGLYLGRVGLSRQEREELYKSAREAEKMASSGDKYAFASTRDFFIAGADAAAVSDIKNAALACEAAFERLFGGGYAAGRAVKNTVRIFPRTAEMKDVEVKTGDGGIFVDIKYHKGLRLEDVCAGLARSLFYGLAGSGGARAKVPHWLELAAAAFVLDEIKLGVPAAMARWGLEVPYASVESILAYPAGGAAVQARRAHAYWLLFALAKLSDKQNLLAFARNAIDGNLTPAETFAEIKKLAAAGGAARPELLLACAMCAEMSARSGGVASPEASEAEVLRMCSVRAFENSEPVSVPFDRLFAHKNSALAPARARLAEVKMLLARTNAVYFNALVALGGVYEAFIEGDAGAHKKRVADFIAEFEKARATAKAVKKAMGADTPRG